MKMLRFALLLVALLALSCQREQRLHTERTAGLVKELLTKLDSADVYAARKEAEIEIHKLRLRDAYTYREKYDILYDVANLYAHHTLDSSLVYFEKAADVARQARDERLRMSVDIRRSTMLTIGGFYMAAAEILNSLPRKELLGFQIVAYYNAWSSLYHELYTSPYEPDFFKAEYRNRCDVYRDSLLSVADTMSVYYLRNKERMAAKVGEFEAARRYNAIRIANAPDSYAYATCLYDRYMLAFQYEGAVTGKDIDDLLEATIIEFENCNRDVNSMLRVVSFLNDIGEVEDAKKISDYYYDSLLKFGSRKRLLECGMEAMSVNEENFILLRRKNRESVIAIIFISLMAIVLLFAMFKLNRSHRRISALKDNLQQSGKISKGYLGAVFKLYSSYIKRLETFRGKIYSTLKKGNIEQTLELASPSKDVISEERKNLFHHFDTAFVDIFPDFIEVVNSCLKPEMTITPKRTEVLNNELRIIALIKLGIQDNEEIAEMLHCSVKTVMNLRAIFRSRLVVSEEHFNKVISEL